MPDICGDNRFEIIENAKKRLIEATNIEDRPDEMAVIDSVLFRMWQMGWLPGCERTSAPVCDISQNYKEEYFEIRDRYKDLREAYKRLADAHASVSELLSNGFYVL